MKVNIKRFDFNNLHQDFKIIKILFIQPWIFIEITGERKVYKERLLTVHSAFLFWKYYYVIG